MNATQAFILNKKYTDDTIEGTGSIKGSPCVIKSITKVEDGNDIEFEWTNNSGTKETQHMIVKDGAIGPAGPTGLTGPAGADGADGKDGENGLDGFSPVATVEERQDGATITITDSSGTTSAFVPSGGGSGTKDYNKLQNLPTINGKEVKNEISEDIAAIVEPLTNSDVTDIENIIEDDVNI